LADQFGAQKRVQINARLFIFVQLWWNHLWRSSRRFSRRNSGDLAYLFIVLVYIILFIAIQRTWTLLLGKILILVSGSRWSLFFSRLKFVSKIFLSFRITIVPSRWWYVIVTCYKLIM
jgi:hypothetical protein